MKRTLAISLWLTLGASAVAQNPAVVQKNVQTAVKASAATQTSTTTKPSPTTVKVVPAAASKPVTVAVKPAAAPAKPTVHAKSAMVAVQKPASKTVAVAVAKSNSTPAVKPVAVAVPAGKNQASVAVAHQAVVVSAPHATVAKADPFKSAKSNAKATPAAKSNSVKVVAAKNNAEDKKPLVAAVARSVGQAGRRDPFISPVVTMSATGSGCSSGKRCLAIDQIALRGIVRSDNGMIAVVVNATDKAYFLRENDPVFNGYVVKITGDSIVFKETFHDKLGKPLTRDITKTISRPVA
jgi:Tfp pilus assembly protein PilP